MAGSAGFLSMEVKLDLDNAESDLKRLAKTASAAFDKPIRIDTGSLGALNSSLGDLERTWERTLEVTQRINNATRDIAASTKNVASAAKEASSAQQKTNGQVIEEERTRRKALEVQKEQVKAAGKVAAVEKANEGKAAYLEAQVKATKDAVAAKQKQVDLEAQHRALMAETAALQKDAAKTVKTAQEQATEAASDLVTVHEMVAKEMRDETEELEKQAEAEKAIAAARLANTSRVASWGLTAGGAASAGNFGYALSALFQAGKAAFAVLKSIPPAVWPIVAAFVAAGVAAVGFAAAITKISKSIIESGLKEGIGLEDLGYQMNALLPTARMAEKELRGLFELGTRTAAPTQTLIELDMRLLRAGGSAARMRKEIVEGFAAFSSAVGLTTENMNSLNYLIGEVNLKGRLMRTEFTTQFASAGLSTSMFLQATADATGKSMAQLNQELEDGTFSATQFNQGMVALFEQMSGGADDALQSFSKQMANLKDLAQASLGQAFLDSGAVAPAGRSVGAIRSIFEQMTPYFRVIADAANELFTAIGDGFKTLSDGGDAGMIQFIFGQLIAGAIKIATGAVKVFIFAFQLIKPIVVTVVKTIVSTFQALAQTGKSMSGFGKVVAGAIFAIVAPIALTVGAVRVLIGILQGAMFMIRAFASALSLNFGEAASNVAKAVGAVAAGFSDAKTMVTGMTGAVKDFASTADKARRTAKNKKNDSGYNPFADADTKKPDKTGGGGGDKAGKAADKYASALNQLFDMTKRWLGMRSELEQSLTGGLAGFSASVDQIKSKGIELAKTLKEAGYSGKSKMVKSMERDVFALVKLAEKRDKLKATLEDQQNKLNGLIADRKAFASQLSQGVIDFVSALNTEEEAVTKYTRLDAVGSFVIEESKKSKSWVQAMKDRLKATQEFIANIRALKAKGLNPETIKQLVNAGPEAAGAAVAELTAGGQETIDEVNGIQSELAKLGEEFGNEQASNYYDAGVQTAQALVDGTEAEIKRVAGAADKISKALNNRLAGIAVEAKEAGSAIGSAIGDGIGESAGSIMDGINAAIGGGPGDANIDLAGMLGLDEMSTDFEQIGRDIIGGLWNGIKDAFLNNPIVVWINEKIVQPVKNFLGISSPSTLFFEIGYDIVRGLWNGITSWFGDLPAWFMTKFQGLKDWFTITLPAWFSSKASSVWDKIKTGFPNMKDFIVEKIKAAQTWLTSSLPTWFKNNMGSVWDKIKEKFPDLKTWLANKISGATSNLKSNITSALSTAWSKVSVSVPYTKLKSIASSIAGAVKDGFNSVIRKWNDLTITFPTFSGSVFGRTFSAGGWRARPPRIPLLAQGGLITGPMLAGLGEAGQEAVVPLTDPRALASIGNAIAQAGGGQPMSVQVFIGNREITDIVRVEVQAADGEKAKRLYAGRGF